MNGISITDVSYQINDTAILRSVSFHSDAKRIAILGRNGSGKSTLSRLICGLDRPNQGVIRINDIDVYADRRAALNTVGMIFQNPDHQIIFPTVIEEMVFGLTQMGVDKPAADQRAMSYLSKFGKSDWRDRAISTLSQGQKKLLCLMAILAMEPKVIILDEPLAALDIPTQRQLTTILQSLPQTLIYITHDTAPIQHYDVAIWLEQGQVVETGSPDTVVPKFIDEMNRIEVL
jgi:biotin transport system ATP-binding protein